MRLAVVATGYAGAIALYLWAGFSLTSPWFVFAAMVCILGLAFVAEPVVRLRPPAALRPVRRWEATGGVYRTLGVRRFGTILRHTPLRALNARVYLAAAGDVEHVRALLESAEASHLLSAVLTAPYMAYAGARGRWGTVVGFSLAQLLLNLYPIAHLRLARHRLERIANRTIRNPPVPRSGQDPGTHRMSRVQI